MIESWIHHHPNDRERAWSGSKGIRSLCTPVTCNVKLMCFKAQQITGNAMLKPGLLLRPCEIQLGPRNCQDDKYSANILPISKQSTDYASWKHQSHSHASTRGCWNLRLFQCAATRSQPQKQHTTSTCLQSVTHPESICQNSAPFVHKISWCQDSCWKYVKLMHTVISLSWLRFADQCQTFCSWPNNY